MRALSIRQPYVEEILRGVKRIEYRTRRTKIIGEPFYIYAGKKVGEGADIPARFAALGSAVGGLPVGIIVATATISKVTPPTRAMPYWHWHLADVKRLKVPVKPKNHPQPSWFNPF